jgi:hypothetical protein
MEHWAQLVRRVVFMITYGQNVREVRTALLAEGLSESEAYLIFCAAMTYCQLI